MNVGYARISTRDQELTNQLATLRAAGCERVYEEQASGGKYDRPQLHEMLNGLMPGDVVTVWKLDRLSRSLKDLLSIMEIVSGKGAGFRSLTESIDTTTPAGRMLMQIVGSFAEFERQMILERSRAGIDAARAAGKHLGRKKAFTPAEVSEIRNMVAGGKSGSAVGRLFRVHRSVISRVVNGKDCYGPHSVP